jgi:hypothetical protein
VVIWSGTGLQKLWIISTTAETTIVNDTLDRAILLKESTAGNIQISGLRIQNGKGKSGYADGYVTINYTKEGRPCILSDCYFEVNSDIAAIFSNSNRGLVYNCSFPAFPYTNHRLAIHHVCNGLQSSWETPSTMGDKDVSGDSNFYLENCDFHAFGICTDFDSNSRAVLRHCTFNNAGLGTHGADTGKWGLRHLEIYDSEFIYNGYGDGQTFPMNWQLYLRGGTAVMTRNQMPNMICQDYGDKTEINLTIQNLQRNSGPNPCWGAGISGVQYPCPRQVGRGFIDGSAGRDSVTFIGESEACYFWDNTGNYKVGVSDYGGSECKSYDFGADYIKAGRDFFNDGTPKPGYVSYQYPHPLRSDTSKREQFKKVSNIKINDATE